MKYASHTPTRPMPKPSVRPRETGPGFFVSPTGDDANPGTEQKPWRTINASLPQLSAGDTLYLRNGTYFENVYCAIAGAPDKPITIRSYPGELATIDAGIPEFQTSPADAWTPLENGEFVSTRTYKNIRDIIGLFGDSLLGLQTYWYLMDLRADNEKWIRHPELMVEPVYCGPGLHYDKQTGKIHARLAHTHLTAGIEIDHYRGETDPRKLPLVVAPFNAKPLHLDQAMHVRFQDLVFRGGALITVNLVFGVDIEFDRCTIYCGTYGIWAKNTGPFRMTNTAVRGMYPSWAWRDENCLYSNGSIYPPFHGTISPVWYDPTKFKAARHISRLPTHALLVTEGGLEHDVYYYPCNHDWDISYCEFTDGHDGVYPTGRDIHFHHNWVDNMNDDGVYVSSPTPYICDRVHIYQNVISSICTAIGAHARGGPGGDVYVYRNVIDMRNPIRFERPTPDRPDGDCMRGGSPFLCHSGHNVIHQERIHFYHNTIVFRAAGDHSFAGGMINSRDPANARRVFNNAVIMYSLDGQYPKPSWGKGEKADLQVDGNLYWQLDSGRPMNFASDCAAFLASPLATAGMMAHDISVDPKMVSLVATPDVTNDYRLLSGSPAIGAGVELPGDYPDPLRSSRPDIGALPANGELLKVGVDGRITAGVLVDPLS